MRYSMLVHLTKMCKTLLEAVRYLRTAGSDSMRAELLENGRLMLKRIDDILNDCREDLHSGLLVEQIQAVARLWEEMSGGEELEAMLAQLTQTLPQEITHQVRAVFFAEMGEKWDAMESVYTYMRDDARFDPVVVLTPVFRIMKQDGKHSQEVIYRDYLSARGIPFLGYDKYSLDADCPDLAFISQPYESCTLEQFWPKNIAQYTRLVYLPYYLPNLIWSTSPAQLCNMPVYQYSWKVVCPNQKQRDYYQEHCIYGGDNILLTGIPKLDPFVTLNERGIVLPEGWGAVEGKKVFLWNSWYDTSPSQRYFGGIINWFREHTDCALIWRPHPLTDAITKLYYPEQYPVYQEKLRCIRNMPNAVLDQEPSCEAAFYYSDALLSDHGSLLPQYLLMDKPALWVKRNMTDFADGEFISSRWMEQTDSMEGIRAFLERVTEGTDLCRELRGEVRREDLPLADGHSGERVCRALWDMMHTEDLDSWLACTKR